MTNCLEAHSNMLLAAYSSNKKSRPRLIKWKRSHKIRVTLKKYKDTQKLKSKQECQIHSKEEQIIAGKREEALREATANQLKSDLQMICIIVLW